MKPQVIVYTTQTCPHCRTAKAHLESLGIAYLEKRADIDPEAQREMQAMGAMGVPTLKVNGQVMVGFNPQQLAQMLLKQQVACPSCGQALRLPADKGRLVAKCPKCAHSFTVENIES